MTCCNAYVLLVDAHKYAYVIPVDPKLKKIPT